jgi:predicted Zn-dependent protease
MTRRLTWFSLLAAALLFVGGCAGASVLPVASIAATGVYKATQASRPINDSEEYYVGRAVAARVIACAPVSQNAQLTTYVNEVGDTVARKSSRPHTFRGYHFAVLETQDINAFACPGGIIFITKGLVQTCDNEDQLAAVLAHEVAHVANKDGVNSISKARWSQVFTAMGAEAARQYGGVAGNLVTLFEGSIDDVFKTIAVNGYSRGAEAKADQDAVATLARAGYDPRALSKVLEKMMAKEKGTSGGIFKTHPPTSQRLANLKTVAEEAPPSKDKAVRTQRFKKLTG